MAARDCPMILVAEVEHLAALDRAALADVIVTTVDERCATELNRCLFASYPGLTLALIVGGRSTVHLGSRDGRALLLCTEAQVTFRSPWLRALALGLYTDRIRRLARR